MSSVITFNGSNYIIPATGEINWGNNVSSYLIAIAAGALQKTGGLFTLSSEVDFGPSFGLKSLYYKAGTGTVSSPSYTFASDTNTGIYSIGADMLGLTANGILRAQVNTDNFSVTDGTVSLPSLAFISDPDTGLYRIGANILGIATAASEALRIDANQKIGINTSDTSQNYQVRINATGKLGLSIYSLGSGSGAYLYLENNGANTWALASNGTGTLTPNTFSLVYSGAAQTSIMGAPSGAISILGTTTNDSATSGYVGEYKESVVSNVTLPLSNQFGDLTSLSLTAGDWDVTGNVHFIHNAATFTATDYEVAITSTPGNSTTGIVLGSNEAEFTPPASSLLGTSMSLIVPSYRISIATTTTYYLKVYPGTYSAGTPKGYGRISARRVR